MQGHKEHEEDTKNTANSGQLLYVVSVVSPWCSSCPGPQTGYCTNQLVNPMAIGIKRTAVQAIQLLPFV